MIKPIEQLDIDRIVLFIQETLTKQNIRNVVLGLSGGIDSTVVLYLLAKAIPKEHIFVYYLPYFSSNTTEIEEIVKQAGLPSKNFQVISIKESVDTLDHLLGAKEDKVRFGNIIARVRMIALFDNAKKQKALVCGTENKSEHYLGYFTRFGDEASDIEPIRHLYKTQVYQVASLLSIPPSVIEKEPTANLWEGQTDESQFGFTYKEADAVLPLLIDEKKSEEDIKKMGLPHTQEIISWVKQNEFKLTVPYSLDF